MHAFNCYVFFILGFSFAFVVLARMFNEQELKSYKMIPYLLLYECTWSSWNVIFSHGFNLKLFENISCLNTANNIQHNTLGSRLIIEDSASNLVANVILDLHVHTQGVTLKKEIWTLKSFNFLKNSSTFLENSFKYRKYWSNSFRYYNHILVCW